METETPQQPLYRVVCLINGKGGMGKTTITSNVGGVLAAAGLRILLVNLDMSTNLERAMGCRTQSDEGAGLVQAIMGQRDLPILKDVRPNLDLIAGGRWLGLLRGAESSGLAAELPGGSIVKSFAHLLTDVAADYDLIILDCAPGNPELQDLALNAARWIVIPTKSDDYGQDGFELIGPRVKAARENNPQLAYLGSVLFAHQTTATQVLDSVATELGEVADRVPPFSAWIRHSEPMAKDHTSRGQLAHEVAADAAAAQRVRLRRVGGKHRAGEPPAEGPPQPRTSVKTAKAVADDYARLAREMLTRIQQHEAASA